MLIDLHVHTDISPCSELSVREILNNARRFGLDGVCLTDHDTMDVRHAVREGIQDDGLLVIVGMEYATPQGDYLIFGPFENIEPGMSAMELLPLVNEAGGAAIAAHPFRANRSADPEFIMDGLVDAFEIVNGRNSHAENNRAQDIFSDVSPVAVAGSDAHTLAELGQCPTHFTVPITSRQEFIDALINGQCQVRLNIQDHRQLDMAVGL